MTRSKRAFSRTWKRWRNSRIAAAPRLAASQAASRNSVSFAVCPMPEAGEGDSRRSFIHRIRGPVPLPVPKFCAWDQHAYSAPGTAWEDGATGFGGGSFSGPGVDGGTGVGYGGNAGARFLSM